MLIKAISMCNIRRIDYHYLMIRENKWPKSRQFCSNLVITIIFLLKTKFKTRQIYFNQNCTPEEITISNKNWHNQSS